MFTKTLIGGAAAALISLGTLAGTATTADAAPYNNGNGWNNGYNGYNNSPGYSFGFGNDGLYFNFGVQPKHAKPKLQKICTPTYTTKKVWRPHYGWVWQTVYAGQECKLVPVKPYKNKWDHDWNHGGDNDWNDGNWNQGNWNHGNNW